MMILVAMGFLAFGTVVGILAGWSLGRDHERKVAQQAELDREADKMSAEFDRMLKTILPKPDYIDSEWFAGPPKLTLLPEDFDNRA